MNFAFIDQNMFGICHIGHLLRFCHRLHRVLNGAKIGKNCLVGAGSLVTEGKEFPDGSMILGSPAKVVRQLTPEQIEGLRRSAQRYVNNKDRFKAGLKKIV